MLKSILKPIGHILKLLIKTALFLLSLLFILMLIIGFVDNKKIQTRERYIQCTKVKKRYTYCCQNPNCKHTYTKIREEEL